MATHGEVAGAESAELGGAYVALDDLIHRGGKFKAFTSGSGVRVVQAIDSKYQTLGLADGPNIETALIEVAKQVQAGKAGGSPEFWCGSSEYSSLLDGEVVNARLDVYPEDDGVTARFYSNQEARFGRSTTVEDAITQALLAPAEPYMKTNKT